MQPRGLGASNQPRNMKLPAMIPSQKPVQLRQKDKLVLLPRSTSANDTEDAAATHEAAAAAARMQAEQVQVGDAGLDMSGQPAHLFEDLAQQQPDTRGRITVYCLAESFNREQLETLVAEK